MSFFTHIFQGFQLDFKLFIMLFLGIISWKGASRFNGWVCFSDGGFIFKQQVYPMGSLVLMVGGFQKKIIGWGGHPGHPAPTMGNPEIYCSISKPFITGIQVIYTLSVCYRIAQYYQKSILQLINSNNKVCEVIDI